MKSSTVDMKLTTECQMDSEDFDKFCALLENMNFTLWVRKVGQIWFGCPDNWAKLLETL